MPVQVNTEVAGAEQGALHQLIEAAGQLTPPDLTRALALPSVRDEVEGRPSRRDLYDAIDRDGLADLAEVDRIAGYDVRGDENVGYFVTFAVIDSTSGVSRGFFPYDEVPLLAGSDVDPDAVPSGPVNSRPVWMPKDYDDLNQPDVLALLDDGEVSPEYVADLKAYEAEHKNRAKIAAWEPASA